MFSYRFITTALLACAAAGIVHAQNYPVRPIRIVTATPGGGNDYLARIVAPPLGAALGQQVIVDNRPSRLVGGLVARATPDGYTLVVGGGTMQSVPLMETVDYDLLADFAPISQLERSPNVLVVHPSLKVSTVAELVALARAKPGALLYATGGSGGSLHLGGEMFMLATNVKISRVPYKSTGPALLGLLTNEVHMVFATTGGAMAHVRDGRLKALGVTTAKRSSTLPDVASIAESGLKGFDVAPWFGILAPAKTPPAIVARLYDEIVKVLRDPGLRERLARDGVDAAGNTAKEFGTFIRVEMDRWAKAVKESGAKAD